MNNSQTPIPARLLNRISQLVADRLGLRFENEGLPSLGRGLQNLAVSLDFENAEACAQWMLSTHLSTEQLQQFARFLTVGESYFFRDKPLYDFIINSIIPDIEQREAPAQKRLHIWSAGCAAGEEPYSLAIMLGRHIFNLQEWNFHLLATDINPQLLAKARKGVYRQWSFRGVSDELKRKFFTPVEGNQWKIHRSIQSLITFDTQNLIDASCPLNLSTTEKYDLILCRNVLMYFTNAQAQATVSELTRCLATNGYFMISPSESHLLKDSGLHSCDPAGQGIYHKPQGHDRVSLQCPNRSQQGQGRSTDQPVDVPGAIRQGKQGQPNGTIGDTRLQSSADVGGDGDNIKPTTAQSDAVISDSKKLLSTERYQDAVDILSSHPAILRENAVAQELLARCMANLGRIDQALTACRQAVALDTINPGLYYLLSTIFQADNNPEKAIGALKRVLFLDPKFVLAHFSLGHLFRRSGQNILAVRHFKSALDILQNIPDKQKLAESGGLTAGRLRTIIENNLTTKDEP